MSLRPEEFQASQWRSVGIGTPDHFHACSDGESDVPYNWAGVSQAFDGNGYAGIFVWMNTPSEDLNNYREYLQCKLVEPLRKDSVYILEFHFRLSSYSAYAIDRIGLLLQDSLVYVGHDKALEMKPTLSVILDSALTENTGLWESAKMEYKAHGGERYLLIGNFFNAKSTHYYKIQFRPLPEPMLSMGSYYYIDGVKVIPRYIPADEILAQLIPEFSEENIKPDKNYILKNIQFEFNSYELSPSSFGELNRVADFLKKNPKVTVQFFGHTDDQGNEFYNQNLSLNRAKSAASYLIDLGFDKNRFEVYGFGKTRPLIQSTSEDARRINRRVEVRFVN